MPANGTLAPPLREPLDESREPLAVETEAIDHRFVLDQAE